MLRLTSDPRFVQEPPVAESAGDEHAAAGGLTAARHHRHDLHGQVKNLPPRERSTYRAEHYWLRPLLF